MASNAIPLRSAPVPCDPETLSYTGVEPAVLERLAASYRRGLVERFQERQIVTAGELPQLVFVGHADDPEPWTMLQTSQGTHWYFGSNLTDEGTLAHEAYEFGRAEGLDHWS